MKEDNLKLSRDRYKNLLVFYEPFLLTFLLRFKMVLEAFPVAMLTYVRFFFNL